MRLETIVDSTVSAVHGSTKKTTNATDPKICIRGVGLRCSCGMISRSNQPFRLKASGKRHVGRSVQRKLPGQDHLVP